PSPGNIDRALLWRPIQCELSVREGVDRYCVETFQDIPRLEAGRGRGRVIGHFLDHVAAIHFQQDAHILWQWITPDPVLAPLARSLQLAVEDLLHLMAVHAATAASAAWDVPEVLGSILRFRGKGVCRALVHL